jgi:predicted membrane chloride channel (bestrophin family)
VNKHLFRGNPRLLIGALPWAVGVLVLKFVAHEIGAEWLNLSPLLAGALAAEVFILGFLLSGTAGDFKEAERQPGEVAASLETMADECLITYQDLELPEARACLQQLIEISASIRLWLMQDRGFDDVLSDIRALNGPFRVMAPAIQAGFTTRLKSEQAAVRRTVIRMDTMRRTSYVAAGYLIAEVTAVLLLVFMVVTDFDDFQPTLWVSGLIAYLLFYVVGLIRDLDNPFEYRNGEPGAADVNLDVLERSEDRLRALLGSLDAAPAAPDSPSTPATSATPAEPSV